MSILEYTSISPGDSGTTTVLHHLLLVSCSLDAANVHKNDTPVHPQTEFGVWWGRSDRWTQWPPDRK